MPKPLSKDEKIELAKNRVRDGQVLVKAAKAPPSWDPENRTARFVMSAEVADRDRDIVVINGIDTSLFEKNPIALWSHAAGIPIGTWSDLSKVQGRPKRLEGTLNLMEGDDMAERVARYIGAGVVRACSIGFMVDWDQVEVEEEDANGRIMLNWRFNSTSLIECSPCSIPANQLALAKGIAAEDRKTAMELVEEVLDSWARLPSGLTVPRSEYEAEMKRLKGETTFSLPADLMEEAPKVDSQEKAQGWLARIAKAIGLTPEPKEEPEAPEPELPRLATAEEKAAAQARAEAALQRIQKTVAQGV